MHHLIQAMKGSQIQAKCWQTEAAIRLLMNNLDPEVAENPAQLIVYGGMGKAARNWACYHKIVEVLKRLEEDETLLIQSGKPVGVFKTHLEAPRVLIANSNLVPAWATWERFHELDRLGLMMFGQMTAGSWIYIGSQGIIQGTYETFCEMGKKHYNNDLRGKWILTAGLGGMGGAQPLAATMAGACMLAIECDPSRIEKRIKSRYLDYHAEDLDTALNMLSHFTAKGEPKSIGLVGNAAEIFPLLLQRGIRPHIVTDQTSAHDPLNGYLPIGWTLEKAQELRRTDPNKVIDSAKKSIAKHLEAMIAFHELGIPTVDYGNNIRQIGLDAGVQNAFSFPSFVPAYIRPLFCQGIGPFRWVALSGNREDIYKIDAKIKELFPSNPRLNLWIDQAQEKIQFQGLPARICWLGLGDRAKLGLAINNMVANGELLAPIAIGRDHLDSGSVASPNRETEAMLDGSDSVADWPLLNALLNCASGATWVSIHQGGGVGIGYSQHAGMVIVADGSKRAEDQLRRVLTNDPATGVLRHADAGYAEAIECAKKNALDLPMVFS